MRYSSKFNMLITILLSTLLFSHSAFADIVLPDPQTKGGMGIFDTLKKRSSTAGGGFPTRQISDQELSTLLWAASGLNRGKNGWTVPMAQGKPPYVKIYVAGKNGIYLYDWNDHKLIDVKSDDIRADIGLQTFTRRAYYSLIFVADDQVLSSFNDDKLAAEFSQVAVGAMTQNIYLASAAMNISARYIHSIKSEIIIDELKLSEKDVPIALMLLGK